jgi:hypothetical protein
MKYSSRNAAQASIALTSRNYTGPTLLRVINGKCTSPMVAAASWPAQMSLTAKRESSEDINASPKSESSDEEVSTPVKPIAPLQLDQVFKEIGQDVLTGKVAATEEFNKSGTRSTRSRQSRLKDEGPQLPSPPQVKNEPSREDEVMDSWASQPNKRRKTTYGAKNVRTSGNFMPVPAAPSSPERGKPASTFSVPGISHRSPKGRTRSSLNDNFIPPPPLSDRTVRNQNTGCTFNIPADITTDVTSSSTTVSESLPPFDLADPPKFSTKRSNSTSSLSSVDSIASLVLTQERKEALRQGEDGDDQSRDFPTSRCPLCHSKVDQVHLETFNFGRRLNIRDQQRFCQEHKHRDAEKQRQEKEYPSIDWPNLTNNRIPKHIALLGGILKRTLPSHYRDRLDAAMQEAKTSQRGLQRYLKDGVVDVAKHGYYGPKGARIMGHTITTHMSEALKQELKRDKVARAAGVGGYVNAVLVPELAVRLVMEDMGLADEQRARDVLSESSNVGILLNADDENVIREEEGEEG